MGNPPVFRSRSHLPQHARCRSCLWDAMGAASSEAIAHLAGRRGRDGKKLSKRLHPEAGWTSSGRRATCRGAAQHRALLGWNPGTGQEIFSCDELVSAFDIEPRAAGRAICRPGEERSWTG